MERTRRLGKRVGRSVYLHRAALPLLTDDLQAKVSATAKAADWQVERRPAGGWWAGWLRLTVLYPAGASGCLHPPILHYKELLLPPGYPWVSEFASLSAALEAKGLFVDRTEP
ncbi:hypothetical protein ACFSKY_21585 [Azotobacter chroococcum]|uniref:hypothetical protein n=1 Tax=Azotobacter chroococcum TaxID=353 RepID=UPI00103BCC03|nr:hypothetical protein [Azotobacter chroococcum]TBV91736.1 hypothetical protein E0E53_19795 [Azotobacter chroococcum]